MIRIISFVLIITTVTTVYCVNVNSDRVETDGSATLNSLEDIEVLTYFLLWKYNYFQNNDYKVDETQFNSQDISNDNDINESKLRLFIENLKDNKLIQHITNSSSSLTSIDNTIKSCNNIDQSLVKKWQNNMSANKIKNICEAASGCKSSKQLIDLISVNQKESQNVKPVPLTLSQSIVKLCPLMLFQLQEHECIEQRESHYKAMNRPYSGAVWGFALLFVTIVSFCSLIGVAILPLLTKNTYDVMLTLFEGLAVGSLVGSAIFHLIPQAFNLSADGNHDFLWKALIIFGGIYLFFWSERIMRIVVDLRRKQKLKEQPMASCSSNDLEQPKFNSHKQVYFKDYDKPNGAIRNSTTSLSLSPNDSSPEKNFENENEKNLQLTEGLERKDRTNSLLILESIARDRSRSNSLTIRHGHSHGDQRTEIATVAWMIIFGDGLHNFIDGITIGAAFSQSILEGISISVAVICEEFPHELGDFAVLIASGMTMRQALGYNFLSACTCYLGMGFGIALGDLADATPYVFALAGGMFLYIALVDMMGELSAALDKASLQGMSQTFKVLVLQNIGILVGVCTLLFLAKYGEKINFEGLAPPKQSDIPFTES